jgi:uncharacterized alkaline shock family protein YloU
MKTLANGIKVTDAALTQIVLRAAETVEGVKVRHPRRHLDVDVAAGEARVTLELSVEYGRVIPTAARAVQQRVADAVGTMCGVTVRSVDVNVEAVG